MIYKRIEHTRQAWHDVLWAVLLVYNNKLVHSITKMTPKEAMKPSNQLSVKLNLELKILENIQK